MASYPLDFSDRSSSTTSNNNSGSCGGIAAAVCRTSTLTSKMTWDGYEEDLLQAFEEFYRLGDFVDVTLICDDLTLRAHRIVLAACSHFFERILTDSNCKHPVILLNGFEGWEIEACIEFMYRGCIQVPFDKVNELVTTAGVLEIRGLADYVTKLEEMTMGMRMPLPVGMTTGNNRVTSSPTLTRDSSSSVIMTEEPPPLPLPLEPNMAFEFDNNPRSPKCLNLSMGAHLNEKPQTTAGAGGGGGSGSGSSSSSSSISIGGTNAGVTTCTTTSISLPGPIVLRQSPLRRKQARPRRRSGDYVAQDLRKMEPDEDQVIDYRMTNSNNSATTTVTMSSCSSGSTRSNSSPSPAKSSGSSSGSHHHHQQQQQHHPHHIPHHHHHHLDHPLVPPLPSVPPPPPPPLPPPPLLLHHLPHHQHLHHDLPPIIHQASPSNNNNNNNNSVNNNNNNNSDDGISSSNCVISPPNSPPFYFPKASPPSPEEGHHACSTPPIFPPFTNGFGQPSPWPGLPLGPAPIFGRHRAQHSAPRGGPPRAWSNADLTEALHNVWNKKMTTSQASRIFGIPYNSLLMYVRGKYGKSLKLDLLKKGLDMALENKNNNKSKSPETNPPEFSPFPPGIFGEYPPPFPFATALSHILPPPVIDPKIEQLGKTEDLK